ncbi:uncharacterized protein EI90DRAFT_3034837 [Cantharellus anzutake]|uniref:uncharacterized protein n=1 Tax=Cantharellus anzutake TaxID=1750568 RepID=UPI001902DC93|nr:uncharacterized protein EI90DRAFT_3034837 [Cantharellus anzutake]KAF8340254.1 hypothetical protein EI90DRAFT_3034837 [Cantharellus anzutake]
MGGHAHPAVTRARSNTHQGHNRVAQCWPTSGTGTTPPNGSRPRGMLAARRRCPETKRKGEYIGLRKTTSTIARNVSLFILLNKSRSHLYDEGWDDRDETLGMPACAEIAWHSGAILVEIIVVSMGWEVRSRSTCGGQFIRRGTIEYDAAQQVEQVLVPQAPRKQLHRQLEWVEATWDGRDTRTVGPWSFQGAV